MNGSSNIGKVKVFPGFWGGVLLVFLVLLISAVVAILLSHFWNTEDKNANSKAMMGLTNSIAFAFTIGLAHFISKRKFSETFRLQRPNPAETVSFIVTAIGMTILLSELDNVFSILVPKPKFLMELFENLLAGEDVWATAVVLTIVAPVTEELLFRGIIFDGFIKNYSTSLAFVGSAFLFGAVHMNPWQFISAFIIGIYLAWIVHETGSIFQTILIHAVVNGFPILALHYFKLEIVGYTIQPKFGEQQPLQPYWLDLLGFLITGFGLVFTAYLFQKRSRTETKAALQNTTI